MATGIVTRTNQVQGMKTSSHIGRDSIQHVRSDRNEDEHDRSSVVED